MTDKINEEFKKHRINLTHSIQDLTEKLLELEGAVMESHKFLCEIIDEFKFFTKDKT